MSERGKGEGRREGERGTTRASRDQVAVFSILSPERPLAPYVSSPFFSAACHRVAVTCGSREKSYPHFCSISSALCCQSIERLPLSKTLILLGLLTRISEKDRRLCATRNPKMPGSVQKVDESSVSRGWKEDSEQSPSPCLLLWGVKIDTQI